LLRGEIADLAFPVQREEPELAARHPPVVDDAQAASLALPSSAVREADLSEASRVPDQVTCFRVSHEGRLEGGERLVVEVLRSVALEGWELDEQGFHSAQYTQIA
jgi:hypothetical protein